MRQDIYWWVDAPPTAAPSAPLAPASDVVIVGAGYTGLSAAITLARAGRSVTVLDKGKPGEGASTRNGGITSGNIRLSHAEMTSRFGASRATAILAEAKVAREDLYRFIAEERIDCDLTVTGRFSGAANTADYERLARDADVLAGMGVEAYAVPRSDQRNYLGTDAFHGGAVRMDTGGLHPAKFHAGLLRLAAASGATVHGETAVTAIRKADDVYDVATSRGVVRARDVIVGTNGYTDGADPWLRRRLVPVRSRIIATAPLSANVMGELMPSRMMYNDTRKLSHYFRPSPDGRRILFGGRDRTISGEPKWPTDVLRRDLTFLFPMLKDVEIDHSWFGQVAMNRDMIPRVFSRHGIRYAAGYCGSGVVWARWAGEKAALQILGEASGASALDFRAPAAIPLFKGKAWFLPAVFAWMALQDKMASRRR